MMSDYTSRGLDYCHFCGERYNVGDRIPRIIVSCGHTFCTHCLSYFMRNQRIKCPICRKMLRGIESVDKLPLNINILYEKTITDPLLASVNFEKVIQAEIDDTEDEESMAYLCQQHDQRVKHFYCSEHPSIFCRECIKDLHSMEACFVVDLYEIEKMRQLQEQNIKDNEKQLIKRQDGNSESFVQRPKPIEIKQNPILAQVQNQPKRKQRDPVKKALFTGPPVVNSSSLNQRVQEQQKQGATLVKNKAQKDLQNKQAYGPYAEDDFTDSYDAEEAANSSLEEGELDTAQKQKLKRDLLMMGYDEDEDFEDEVGVSGSSGSPLKNEDGFDQLTVQMQRQLELQMKLAQQMQMDPNAAMEMIRQQQNMMMQPSTSEEEKFKMDKKAFAEQMKQDLLGARRKPVPESDSYGSSDAREYVGVDDESSQDQEKYLDSSDDFQSPDGKLAQEQALVDADNRQQLAQKEVVEDAKDALKQQVAASPQADLGQENTVPV